MTSPDRLAIGYHRALAWRWFGRVLPLAVLVPLMLARGLDLGQIGLVMATFSAVTAILEVPTGGLADAVGRVRTSLAADAISIAFTVAFALATDVSGFALAAALGGTGRALGSGALEAWYVDARRRRAPQGDLQGPLARAGVVTTLAIGAGTFTGGFIPLAAPWLGLGSAAAVPALQLAFLASAVTSVIALVATARLRDADAGPPTGTAAARPDRVWRGAWSALAADPTLAALVLLGAATGGVITAFETLFPAELSVRWTGAVAPAVGVAFAGAFAASAAGQALGGRAGRVGTPVRAALGFAGTALATALLAPTWGGRWGVAAAIAALWLAYGALSYAGPALAAAFHARTPSDRRAALLSVQSLAAYAGGVVASLGLGALASGWGLAYAWWTVAGAMVLATGALALVGARRRARRRRTWAPQTPTA